MSNALAPVDYDAPPVNPSPHGLYTVATLIDVAGPFRQQSGVTIHPINCGTAAGTWDVDPCADPGTKRKAGVRPAPDAPFEALGIWGYDECDLTEPDEEILLGAEQNLRLNEQQLVEAHFAGRLLADAVTPTAVGDFVAAVAELEVGIGEAGIPGVIHASRRFAPYAAAANLLVSSGPLLKTPLGTLWTFGGGYDAVLDSTLIATGAVTVWRGETFVKSTAAPEINLRAAIAERVVVAGYECLLAAAVIQ